MVKQNNARKPTHLRLPHKFHDSVFSPPTHNSLNWWTNASPHLRRGPAEEQLWAEIIYKDTIYRIKLLTFMK